MPPSDPSGSGCLSLERDGLQPANSVLSFVLCAVLAVSYVRAFHVLAIPQSGLLAQVSSLRLPSGHSGPCLPAQPPLASGRCRRLRCFSTGGVTVGLVICGFYLFIFPPPYVALCASKAHHGSESVSWCLETSLFLRLPSVDGAPSLPLLSFFVFYIFSYLFSKTMGCFSGCLMSSAGIQKLFCGIYSAFKCSFDEFVGEKVVSLSYSHHLRTTSRNRILF